MRNAPLSLRHYANMELDFAYWLGLCISFAFYDIKLSAAPSLLLD